ncbi:MAG: tetratricopeptide repeat protein [Saprospirales bacterium]|nr:tetratricopeptide repeat protein [Saprospirales bacterium]
MTANTIAVLPFVNTSSDSENEYFCDGITEEIINALARIDGLKVTSRTSSFFFKNKTLPLGEVAAQLGVEVILEGSIRLAGNTVRITAQLIQAEDDFHFWAETWDRKLENIFDIQDEISLLIADKLREQFGHFEISDHLVEKQTESLDAYALSLEAKFHFNKWNPDDVRTAIGLYEKALALDPAHTESYVGLADAYGFLAATEIMPPGEAWQIARANTQKAFSLNPQNPGVHYQLANLSFFTDCDFQEAARHTFKSIELKPNYPEAQQFMAFLYILSGEMDKAEAHLQLAMRIDPFSQETLFYKGYFHYRQGDFQEALYQFETCLTNNPKNIPAFITWCYCLLKLGRFEEVLTALEQLPNDMGAEGDRLGIACLAYLFKKDEENAQRYFAQLQEEAQKPAAFQAHSYLFWVYANMGKTDEAFSWLDQAIQMKSPVFLLSYTDPLVDFLKSDSRYATFRRKLYKSGISPESYKEKARLLDDPTAEAYAARLLQFVQEEEPFLNPNLSLRALAGQIEIHPSQLSWLLNNRLGKNFNEFINSYRVAHFKKLAVDPANAHIALIGLAFECGFNSKTVFNTYFKKEVGMTPKEFLKQHN